ncbi:hypothetical protein M8845_15315 [Gelidibacter japonicus]|uniref:hypothetical protein n=1 Tax=Gelidibacter japonicus TaxID=1962232 RepID=UPI0020200096|nr:hypothetical protein [Gelidibacter japonicus]MCL8008798.1 hypothetical protein [Gelidibacter japonicus]
MRKLILLSISLFFYSILNLSAQDRAKDTLYFKLDGNYLYESKYVENSFLLEDSNDVGKGTFFFEKIRTEHHKEPQKILCLKKYVRSSIYYNKDKKFKLNDYRLWEHLNNYTIYLVKKTDHGVEYIQVIANFEIE